jgi:uncharacterized protein involved in outer membrane biogenesis
MMRPTTKKALALLVLVIAGIVVVVHLWLDAWIKSKIEDIGPAVTGTPVTLDSIRTSLLFGSIELRGLAIGNPKGFQAPHAFKVGSLRVRVNGRSLFAPVLVIEEILIDAPEVTIEGLHPHDNLSQLQRNVRAFSGSSGTAKAATATGEAGSRKVQISDFVMKDGRGTVQFSVRGAGGQSLSIRIPDLHLKDVGNAAGGVPPAKLAAVLIDAIIEATTNPVRHQLKQTGQAVEKAATDILGQAKGLLKK